jgi:ubiquinone/menaquinone biosynthesis C-methylase UbiE
MAPTEAPEDVKARLKASYDAMAGTYNSWTEKHAPLRMQYLDKLCALVPKLTSEDQPSTVLELGCGSGKPFLDALLARGPLVSATANDLSDTQVDLAKENLAAYGERVRFASGDMAAVAFPDGALTAVVALYSLIHLPQEEQSVMLGRIAGWLEPGGCLLVNVSAGKTSGVVYDQWLHEEGWMFWSGLGIDGTVERLQEVGLTIEVSDVEGDNEESFVWIIARRKT